MDPLPLHWYDIIEELEQIEEDVMMMFLMLFCFEEYERLYLMKTPCRNSKMSGHAYVMELMNANPTRCYDMFRMKPDVFITFSNTLIEKCDLKHSRYLSAYEQVAIFLHIIAHGITSRVAAEKFQHSGETISKVFHRVLKAICKLGVEIIAPPNSGFTNMPGFLAPIRGERYHLNDWRNSGRVPQGREELFNYYHSSLRNGIERSFGVLKERFTILSNMLPYPMETQKYIPIACCTVHNFIRKHSKKDKYFDNYADEDMIVEDSEFGIGASSQNPIDINISRAHVRQMGRVRDEIADQIWATFRGT